MTIQIKHAFTSAKGDGGDATLVRPSNWNALHTTSMATGNLLGRLTAGVGSFEEIPVSAYMASLLASADAAALAAVLGLFTTGDVKFTFAAAAPTGWILMLGGIGTPPSTIGNAVSGAVLRANADTLALYTLIYNAVPDTDAPVSGGRTGNAVNDFNANKTIRIPNLVGRSPIGAGGATDAPPGGGNATTAKLIGRGYGEENHALTSGELASHFHAVGISDPGHSHPVNANAFNSSSSTGGGGFSIPAPTATSVTGSATTGIRATSANGLDTTASTGSGTAHNTIHSSIALNVMVKL